MTLEFPQTNWLRFISILMLGIANINLLYSNWFNCLICLGIAAFLEWNRQQLHQTLTNQHFADIERAKSVQREQKARIVEEVRRNALNKALIK